MIPRRAGPSAPDAGTGLTAHVAALDGVRAIAVGLVVLTHAAYLTGSVTTGGFWGALAGRGDFGVALFFTLSGYLLHRGFLRAPGGRLAVGNYYLRRAARVLPAYWVTLAAVAVAARPAARDVLLHALGIAIYAPGSHLPSFSQAWSIATELSFYLVLPAAVLGLNRLRRARADLPLTLLTGLLPVALAITWLTPAADLERDIPFERWLPARGANFLIGMILAEAALRQGHRISRRLRALADEPGPLLAAGAAAYVLATTPIAGMLTLGVVSGWALSVKMTLSCVFAGALLLPIVLTPGTAYAAWLGRPVPAWLGRISYGIFLWHLPVFVALYAVTGVRIFSGGLLALLAIGVPITLALATASYHWVELPVMRWAGRRRRVPDGAPDARDAAAPAAPRRG